MDKLELKHIAPYLPYGLKVQYIHTGEVGIIRNLVDIDDYYTIKIGIDYKDSEHIWMFKPILRPLSEYKNLFGKALSDLNCDLETQIQITEFANQDRSLNSISYDAYNELVKAKVDVFGLIEKGLAIDINTL